LDDGLDFPGEGWIRAALAVVVTGLHEVPEMVDHAGADERAALGVEGDAPGIAGSFTKNVEFLGFRVDAVHRAGEAKILAVLLDVAVVEDAVEAVQVTVRAPGEGVGQLVGVVAAKARDDDLRLAGRLAVGSYSIEKNLRRVGHPHAAMT